MAPLKVKALADSKLAVWQREDRYRTPVLIVASAPICTWMAHRVSPCREDLGSILAFENFDGAVEQDSKATVADDGMQGHEIP